MGDWEEKVAQPNPDNEQKARVGHISQGMALTHLWLCCSRALSMMPKVLCWQPGEWLLLQSGGGTACFYLVN